HELTLNHLPARCSCSGALVGNCGCQHHAAARMRHGWAGMSNNAHRHHYDDYDDCMDDLDNPQECIDLTENAMNRHRAVCRQLAPTAAVYLGRVAHLPKGEGSRPALGGVTMFSPSPADITNNYAADDALPIPGRSYYGIIGSDAGSLTLNE